MEHVKLYDSVLVTCMGDGPSWSQVVYATNIILELAICTCMDVSMLYTFVSQGMSLQKILDEIDLVITFFVYVNLNIISTHNPYGLAMRYKGGIT